MSDALAVTGLAKRWDDVVALDGLDLDFGPEAYTCIMGPSGSGKSTLLRILAGFETPDAGDATLGGSSLLSVPAHRRPIHTVFQDQALFPHFDVEHNVDFAGRVSGMSASERSTRAASLLREVGLDPERFASRSPQTLSGGERQRVALARALFDRPRYLLLDEPLSAIDRSQRSALRRKLVEVQRKHGIGFVHVTHDPEEALGVADDLVVLVQGRVAARGRPAELYERPPTFEVASLLGELTEVVGGWIRPERLRPAAGTQGRLAVRELGRSLIGPRWEVRLESEQGPIVAHVDGSAPASIEALDWDDADVLDLGGAGVLD